MKRRIKRILKKLCGRCGHEHKRGPSRPCARLKCGCKRLVLRGGKVTRLRSNPTLVTFGNPLTVLTKDVVEIKYKHAEDGGYYQHHFQKGQVRILGQAGAKRAIIERVDGKPLLGDY